MEQVKGIITTFVGDEKYELDLEELANRIRIDPNAMDDELEEQAELYFNVALLATNAVMNAEMEKHAFKVFEAELENSIRLDLESKGGKVAAATVTSAARSTKEYAERDEELVEFSKVAALFETVRDAVRMRQYTLLERSRRMTNSNKGDKE